MQIRTLDSDRAAEWDRLVHDSPEGTFFHLAGWREVLTRGCGIDTHYLFAERGGHMVGVLPLAHLRSLLFGSALVSTPFCVVGGALADDPAVARALEDAAADTARRLRVRRLELRNRGPRHPQWPALDVYCTFRRPLAPTVDDNLAAIPRKQRAAVRQSLTAGLTAHVDAELERFYRVYATSVRNLGSPVYSRRFFAALVDVFRRNIEIVAVDRAGRDVTAVMSFYFKDQVMPYYGGGLPEARGLKAYDFMYWDLMRRACERGCTTFDFGRSMRGTGSFAFKKNWGFAAVPLRYEFLLLRGRSLPDRDPDSRLHRLLTGAWRRLPLTVANRIGPWLAPQFT